MKKAIGMLILLISLSLVSGLENEELSQHNNTLIVGIEEDYPPFVYLSEDRVKGVSIDYLRLISGELNMIIVYSEPTSLPNLFNKIKEGKIEMITSLTRTPEREEFLIFTEPYIKISAGLFSTRREILTIEEANEKRLKVAVGNGYGVQSFLQENYPNLTLVLVKNDLEALKTIKAGEADLAVSDLGSVSYLVEQNNLDHIYFIGKSGFDYELSFAFSKEDAPTVEAFNRAIKNIPLETNKEIETKWFVPESNPLYFSQTLFFITISFIFGITFLVYIYSLWKINNR